MSFLGDLFGGANNAAQDQISGIKQGLSAATDNINTGNQALTSNYTSALQPYLQNYGQAQTGVNALQNLEGLNGAAGSNNAQAALTTMPGYQAALGAGNNAVNAQAAAGGTLNSGNQALALQKQGQNTANQNYNSYVSQLQPWVQSSNANAAGIGNTYQGLGNSLNQNQNTMANLNVGAYTGIGNANANADLANQSMGMGLLGGLLNFGASAYKYSDERLKENIDAVGELYDGTRVYRYNYRGDDTPQIGVMAQEIEKQTPEAVREFGGFKAVNYAAATELAAALGRFVNDEAA